MLRRSEQLPLRLPSAISLKYQMKPHITTLMIATRATTQWLKQPTFFSEVTNFTVTRSYFSRTNVCTSKFEKKLRYVKGLTPPLRLVPHI